MEDALYEMTCREKVCLKSVLDLGDEIWAAKLVQ
jgi:hypothetical protein